LGRLNAHESSVRSESAIYLTDAELECLLKEKNDIPEGKEASVV